MSIMDLFEAYQRGISSGTLESTITTITPPSFYISNINNYEDNTMKIECLAQDPKLLPARAHRTDAGADLKSAEAFTLLPGESKLVDTGVAVKIPQGYGGFVLNRSSQRVKGITSLGTGLIDPDYRGNIKVFLVNEGDDELKIAVGDRIGQLVIIPVVLATYVDCWNDTERGTGGFGSTGAK
jgi:dUTP pyrophosphatase